MASSETNQIARQHSSYARRFEQWRRIRFCIDGSDAIKDQGEIYLPKPSGQDAKQYAAYLKRAVFYPTADRTLRGLNGMVFRRRPVLELPPRLEPMRKNLTSDGYSFEILCEEIVRELLSVGRYGMLLDYPSYVESSSQLPYIATYFARDIVNWRQQFIEGNKVLTRIVLRDEIDNEYEDDTTKYLELILNEQGNYEVRKWISNSSSTLDPGNSKPKSSVGTEDGRSFTMIDNVVPTVNGKPLRRIPFFFVNPYDHRPEVEKPPMLDLVDMSLAYYRNSADYEHALYLTAQPTPWIAGSVDENNKPDSIGAGSLWLLKEDTTVGMLEFSGKGLDAMRLAMEDKKANMAALGARMIYEGVNRNETTETARMRTRGELSLLTNVVNSAESALNSILELAGEWAGGTSGGKIRADINHDWIESRMSAEDLMALVKSWQSGAISRETLHHNLQKGEIVQSTRTVEDETDAIKEEGGDPSPMMMSLIPDDDISGTGSGEA